ncbi:histone acetyltransferase subunit NuA4-domain-containing protein [Gilbertella persicaria]|uniref:histone acetyltransferase subunit NuA4-domain-containing protein n=1 Tax=Gilbertella persicaria TaxID=101096 RepID=UPI0022201D51|nr:histone acetyltransferase subunit NuA4-domain-containing protein [Gilbertella persicaria]KAI8071150.1 histone acetyltransferase subunit NuA4-domain-containing protein [Gilbertella persicaria]
MSDTNKETTTNINTTSIAKNNALNTTTNTPAAAQTTQTTTTTTETPAEPPQVTRQKYEEAKHELQALLARKKQVDTNLINLENSIYLFEGSYLEDTHQNGNIIRGFDGYLTNRTDRRRPKFTELDRLFSLSSSTYQKALAQKEEKDQDSSQDDRSVAGSPSARREKKRKLKHDGNGIKKKRSSAGRDTEDELDV